MAKVSKGRYTYYKALVEQLGLRQLDVYRVQRRGSPTDVIRLLDPATRKVYEVDIGTVRESLGLDEFVLRVKEQLEKQGYKISDRTWSAVTNRLAKLKKPSQHQA